MEHSYKPLDGLLLSGNDDEAIRLINDSSYEGVDSTGKSKLEGAFITAIERGRYKVVEALIKKGVNINARYEYIGSEITALDTLVMQGLGNEKSQKLFSLLVKNGANVNSIINDEKFMLLHANPKIQGHSTICLARTESDIKFILKSGANINLKDDNGFSCLQYISKMVAKYVDGKMIYTGSGNWGERIIKDNPVELKDTQIKAIKALLYRGKILIDNGLEFKVGTDDYDEIINNLHQVKNIKSKDLTEHKNKFLLLAK